MHIAIVGSGYVGLVAGACFADWATKSSWWTTISRNWPRSRTDRSRSTRSSCPNCWSVIAATVSHFPTICEAPWTPARPFSSPWARRPPSRANADLSYVESVARSIPSAINGYKVVVEKSTVPVYTSDWIRKIILRNAAAPDSFDVASNPEFLREGTAVTDFLYPDRIVVGADNERCASVLREIYAPLTDGSYYQRPDAIPAPGPGAHSAAADRHQHQERGTDQARLQCISGDEDFVHQCGRVDLRIGRSRTCSRFARASARTAGLGRAF